MRSTIETKVAESKKGTGYTSGNVPKKAIMLTKEAFSSIIVSRSRIFSRARTFLMTKMTTTWRIALQLTSIRIKMIAAK